jgi:hypothetical protein
MAYEITNPSYFRNALNSTGTILAPQLFVDWSTNENEVALPAGVTSRKCAGVVVESIGLAETRSIQVEGVALVKCSAAIAANAEVQSGADGRAATAVTASIIRGRAKNATTNANDLVSVELYKTPVVAP